MAHEHRHHIPVAVTLAAAAVVAAGLGARAAVLFDHSSDELHSSVRQEVKRDVAMVEDVRFVYQDEAPLAYRVLKARIRAQEFERVAGSTTGMARQEALVEADLERRVAKAILGGSDIAKSGRYNVAGGGFDLPKRLHDVREENPDLVEIDPGEPEHAGSRAAWHGTLDAAATLAPALAFLLGAIAQAWARLRRPFVAGAWALILVGIGFGIAFEVWLP